MPGSAPLPLDLRLHSPASVLVLDLVKHSAREPETIQVIQRAVESILRAAVADLGLKTAHFGHTGDGYICTLAGDDSPRLMDFINVVVPQLSQTLRPHAQAFRIGLDFGMVHFRHNSLTETDTHFDVPGIRASRLEQAAMPGGILCTTIVYDLFQRHYPQMFSEMRTVETKDRSLIAHEVVVASEGVAGLHEFLTALIYRNPLKNGGRSERRKLLLVDDESQVLDCLSMVLQQHLNDCEVVTAKSGFEALQLFAPRRFIAAVVDFVMPGMTGTELVDGLLRSDPNLVVIGISGYSLGAQQFYSAGAFSSIAKPFSFVALEREIAFARSIESLRETRRQIGGLARDPDKFWELLQIVAHHVGSMTSRAWSGDEIVQGMLRHKAKHLVNDSVTKTLPGRDPTPMFAALATQLGVIERLAWAVEKVKGKELKEFVEGLVADTAKMHKAIQIRLEQEIDASVLLPGPCVGVSVLAVSELLDNAIAALAGTKSGEIAVGTALLKTARILQLTVRDNGPGVSLTVRDRLFEEGASTKGEGRGLGLYLIGEAVRRLGGEVELEASNGTCFEVRIPIDRIASE